jgi:amino acid transporter
VGSRPSGQLARRLTTTDAVVIGLGAMIGAGVFAAPGPAAAVGTWLLAGLAIASFVAYANATLLRPARGPLLRGGGTYVYARKRLGDDWGFLAGWSFVVGKTASLAAMALTFGAYVAEDLARPLGIGAVVAMAVVNVPGVEKTARLTRVLVALIFAALAVIVSAALLGGQAGAGNLTGELPGGVWGVLQPAAAVLRLRRLRPPRHPRRGGQGPHGHHPPSHPYRPGHRRGRLRRRAHRRAAGHRPAAMADSLAPLAAAVGGGLGPCDGGVLRLWCATRR